MKKITVDLHHYQLPDFAAFMAITGSRILTGYFWGKKSVLQEFAEQIKNESFSDRVYASLCELYDQPGTPEATETSEAQEAQEPIEEQAEEKESLANDQQRFVAQLIGYGTAGQAQA